MASKALSGWTAVFKELQRWNLHPPTAEQAAGVVPRVNKLLAQLDSLPAPAVEELLQDAQVQVTRQLAVHCVQAFQLHTNGEFRAVAASAFAAWLSRVKQTLISLAASPESPVVASVRQQLQHSGLLQHMSAMLTAAAHDLAEAAAALAASAKAGASSSSAASRNRSSMRSSSSSAAAALYVVGDCLKDASNLLDIRNCACWLLSKVTPYSLEVVLPTAPAAVRLALCIYQTCSSLQQLAPSSTPVQRVLQSDAAFQDRCATALSYAYISMHHLAVCIANSSWLDAPRCSDSSNVQTALALPGAREALLCPELVPALAISVLVAVLAQGTGEELSSGAGSIGASDAAAAAGAGSGSSSSASRSPPTQGSSRQQRRQQQRQERRPARSAAVPQQQPGSAGSGGRLSSAVRSLDSLTPLSSSLFGLLGVDREVLLQAALRVNNRTHPDHVFDTTEAYSDVLDYQVRTALSDAPYTAELLQTLETDMLLSLAVRQLTASMPDGYADAEPVRELACRLNCSQLSRLFACSKQHRLPLSVPYTGPQLALQVLPSPVGPPATTQEQQQQQAGQQQQADQQQWYVVTPTAQLLNELLPLLTSYCLSRLQQLQQKRQQQLGAVFSKLQRIADGGLEEQPAACGSASAPGDMTGSSLLSALDAASCSACLSCRKGLQQCMQLLETLLQGALVPAPDLTAAQLQPAADFAANGGPGDRQLSNSCVLHAPDALLQHAGGVMRVCEALLRDAAVLCEAAAQLDDGRVAAAVTNKAEAAQRTAAGVAAAQYNLVWVANKVTSMCQHQLLRVSNDTCRGPSALGLAAAAAGPGSQLQRQMHSLLCSMVKLGDAAAANTPDDDDITDTRNDLNAAASDTAHALLGDAAWPADQHAVGTAEGGGRGGAVAALPSVVILGRCCSLWAAQLQSAPAESLPGFDENPLYIEMVLSHVRQWLQEASTQEQLVAAGYAPQAVLQQLQQVLAAVLQARLTADFSGDARLYTASREEAAEQLRAVGAALCSFAVPCMCNNAACCNVSGQTEVGLVSGRSCLCSGCRVARYCSRACQCAAWKQHKPVCAALAAAAAAGAAAAAPAAGV